MSGVQRGVTNAFGLPAISAATTDSRRPRYGIPWQLFFNVNDKIIYYDDGTNWSVFSQPGGGLTFGSGLTKTGLNVTNNLTTGKIGGQTIIGTPNDEDGILLTLKAQDGAPTGQDNVAIRFYSDDAGADTYYFQSFGAWNFGGNSNPLLTTPYQYVFQNRGVFNARWDFNANIALLNTTGSHIQSAWQTTAPTGNANQTHLFFDSVGSPSFRIGTNNWFKFTPNTLTANRNYTLQDANYQLAGIDIAQTFSALQTFSAGATFGAAINAIAGSAATPSINFGTTNTGLYGDATSVRTSIAGNQRLLIDANGGIFGTSGQGLSVNIASATPMITMVSGSLSGATARCLDILCNPNGSAQTGSYTAGVISNLSNQTGTSSHRSLYVSNFETGRTATGNIFLLDLGTNSNSNGQVSTHSSKFNVSNSGKLTSSANAINFATQTPASATAVGTTGDIAWDTNYIYVCVNTNTWKRSSITTW